MGYLAPKKRILGIHMRTHQWVEDTKSDTNTSCPSVYCIHLQDVFLGRTPVLALSPSFCLPKSSVLRNKESASFESSLPLYCLSAVCFYFKEKKLPIKLYWYFLGKPCFIFYNNYYLICGPFSVKHWLTDEQNITAYISKFHEQTPLNLLVHLRLPSWCFCYQKPLQWAVLVT